MSIVNVLYQDLSDFVRNVQNNHNGKHKSFVGCLGHPPYQRLLITAERMNRMYYCLNTRSKCRKHIENGQGPSRKRISISAAAATCRGLMGTLKWWIIIKIYFPQHILKVFGPISILKLKDNPCTCSFCNFPMLQATSIDLQGEN